MVAILGAVIVVRGHIGSRGRNKEEKPRTRRLNRKYEHGSGKTYNPRKVRGWESRSPWIKRTLPLGKNRKGTEGNIQESFLILGRSANGKLLQGKSPIVATGEPQKEAALVNGS